MQAIHINSFPAEVLAEIIYTHTQAIELRDLWQSNSTLCLVCQRWKDVAISDARLWATIHLDLAIPHSRPPAPIVDLWLERSMATPLEIHFFTIDNLTFSTGHDDLRYLRTLFDCLARHVYRWRRLVIELNGVLAGLMKDIPLTAATQLRFVDASVIGLSAGEAEASTIRALGDAPNLRSLKWSTRSLMILEGLPSIFPLERLTHFDIFPPMSIGELLAIMECCTSTIHMSIGTNYSGELGDEEAELIPPVFLPNLRTLRLSIDTPEYKALKYFDFPNLQILSLNSLFWKVPSDDHDLESLSQFISDSRHSLRVLMVRNGGINPRSLPAFLSNPKVVQIPIVQIYTYFLPAEIHVLIHRVAEACSPEIRRADFKVIPDSQCPEGYMKLGWGDIATYMSVQRDLSYWDSCPLDLELLS